MKKTKLSKVNHNENDEETIFLIILKATYIRIYETTDVEKRGNKENDSHLHGYGKDKSTSFD